MSRLLFRCVDHYWCAPAPARRLATLRVLVGAFCVVFLVVRAPVLADFTAIDPTRFAPVGVVRLLQAPLPAPGVWGLWALCLGAGLAFTLGYRFRVSGPCFALLFLWVTSYRNSFGMLFHTENLVVLHVVVLSCSRAADALTRDRAPAAPPPQAHYGWPIRLLRALTVATYLLAGLAKLRVTGLDWAQGEVLCSHLAYDAVRKLQLGSVHAPLGLWVARAAWPCPVLSVLTLGLEVGAPLALLGRWSAWPWTAGVWGFHVGILLSMAITFPYPLSGVGLAAFFPVERLWHCHGLAWLERRLWAPLGSAPGATYEASP